MRQSGEHYVVGGLSIFIKSLQALGLIPNQLPNTKTFLIIRNTAKQLFASNFASHSLQRLLNIVQQGLKTEIFQ